VPFLIISEKLNNDSASTRILKFVREFVVIYAAMPNTFPCLTSFWRIVIVADINPDADINEGV
jgi:hypothetical protein